MPIEAGYRLGPCNMLPIEIVLNLVHFGLNSMSK